MAGSGSRTELHPPQRRRFGPRRLAAFGVLVIIGGIAVAAPVYAFVSTSSHDVKVHKFARGSTTATCPKGEHVAFGGVVAQYQPAGPGPKYVLPTGMRRTADDRLTAYGFNNSRATEGHLTAVAHCDRGNVPTAVEKSQLLPGGEGGSVVATCPAGTVVVGGGFDTYGGPRQINLVDRLERVSARQWLASANSITPNPTNLTAIAYCAPGAAPKVYSVTVKVPGHTGGTARVSCPSGTSLAFGGIEAAKTGLPYDAAHTAQVEAFSWTAASTSQWVVRAFNVGSRTGNLVALAYCR